MSNKAERVKRGFTRLAIVGSLAFLILSGVSFRKWYVYGGSINFDDAGMWLTIDIAWSAFWLLLSWIIRGFMDEGS